MRLRPGPVALLVLVMFAAGCANCPGCPESAEKAGLPARVDLHDDAPER